MPSIRNEFLIPNMEFIVLNLIITGMPSIQRGVESFKQATTQGFKPYYKWNTFNT